MCFISRLVALQGLGYPVRSVSVNQLQLLANAAAPASCIHIGCHGTRPCWFTTACDPCLVLDVVSHIGTTTCDPCMDGKVTDKDFIFPEKSPFLYRG